MLLYTSIKHNLTYLNRKTNVNLNTIYTYHACLDMSLKHVDILILYGALARRVRVETADICLGPSDDRCVTFEVHVAQT